MYLKNYQKQALDRLSAFLTEAKVLGDSRKAFETQQEAPGYPPVYTPLKGLEDVPYICLRLPTGGGKTLLASHAIPLAARNFLEKDYPFVLWLVPTDMIRKQTYTVLSNLESPNRKVLEDAFGGRVRVYDITEFTRLRPQDVTGEVNLFVATFASFRVKSKEGRKVYAHHEFLEPCFRDIPKHPYFDEDENGYATFRNLLAYHRPLVIIDEAHNHASPLSLEVMQRLRPSAIIELTATPAANSNVLFKVSASELKAEDMIKLPIVLTEHQTWEHAADNAVQQRIALEKEAAKEPDYVRPIAFFQAENKDREVTAEKVRRYLIEEAHVPEDQIAIATGDKRELDGVNLMSPNCLIRYVITVQALKEGWDCPFAYVFCSLAQVHSPKDAEQLLGRVLRMPYAKRRVSEALNRAYAHVAVTAWMQAVSQIRDNLLGMGFEDEETREALQHHQPSLPGLEIHTSETERITLQFQTAEPPPKDTLNAILQEGSYTSVEILPEGGCKVVIEQASPKDLRELEMHAEQIFSNSSDRASMLREIRRKTSEIPPLVSPIPHSVKFTVPQLCLDFGEGTGIYAAEPGDFLPEDWRLTDNYEPTLPSFHFDTEKHVYEFDVMGHKVTERHLGEGQGTLLPGETNWELAELVGWLARKTLDIDLSYEDLVEFTRRTLTRLMELQHVSLADLVRLRFVLAKLFAERIADCKNAAYEKGMQGMLFQEAAAVRVTPDVSMAFRLDSYPAKSFYRGSKVFQHHFYSLIGAMDSDEEVYCAQCIDAHPNVETWVRNIPKDARNSFWLPTHKDKFYPDFVVKLKDDTVAAIEYKGAHLISTDDAKEKDMVGRLWAEKSQGRCRFLMATKRDEKGRDLSMQIKEFLS